MLIIGWIVAAVFTAWIASEKNRSFFIWLILAFLFPLITLIAIAVVPKLEDHEAKIGAIKAHMAALEKMKNGKP